MRKYMAQMVEVSWIMDANAEGDGKQSLLLKEYTVGGELGGFIYFKNKIKFFNKG